MDLGRQRLAAGSRLLLTYLVVSLVPVLALMLAMPAALRLEARSRGLAEARAQAALLAQASVEPVLGTAPLRGGVSRAQTTALARLAAQAVQEGHIVRLRLRDIDGRVVFADDADLSARADDEVTEALQGEVNSVLTRLNADPGERLPLGSGWSRSTVRCAKVRTTTSWESSSSTSRTRLSRQMSTPASVR